MLENNNPNVYSKISERPFSEEELDNNIVDELDAREIFDIIRNINDPEHPLTLEELRVVEEDLIKVDNRNNKVDIFFTPTIPHCTMATLIGLCISVKLLRSLPTRIKLCVKINPGSHNTEQAVNKQLADKERVAAALENVYLVNVINECITIKRNSKFFAKTSVKQAENVWPIIKEMYRKTYDDYFL